MPRFSIEISETQHERLQAVAAREGLTIEQFVIDRALGQTPTSSDFDEEKAMDSLASYLDRRMQEVRDGDTVEANFDAIRDEAAERAKAAG